jgi:GDPmannose 4,6-dehydratase
MSKTALITGITGQDGYYLAKHLVLLGYSVIGYSRRNMSESITDLQSIGVHCISEKLESTEDWLNAISQFELREIYHLAGMTYVPQSWEEPQKTLDSNVSRTLSILEAIRFASHRPHLFFAGSSEVFGIPSQNRLDEDSPFRPSNPYGVSKAASMGLIECYRNRYGIFACSGILFNHESPRRSKEFVTRKITHAAASIAVGLQDRLLLGCLDVSRDWGYAGDFVDCMHRMLNANAPSDFVIGTGKLTTLEYICQAAFERVGLRWQDWVGLDPRFSRPKELKVMLADSTKAKKELGWTATTSIEQVIHLMVDNDLQLLRDQKRLAA